MTYPDVLILLTLAVISILAAWVRASRNEQRRQERRRRTDQLRVELEQRGIPLTRTRTRDI